MIDEKLQEQLLEVFDKRFQDYNTKVLKELGNIIKQFKDLTPSQAHSLAQCARGDRKSAYGYKWKYADE